MDFKPKTSLLHQLHRASQVATDRFTKAAGGNNVTVRQLVILSAIAAHDDPSQTDLVAVTGVDRSTLADVMKRLIKRGLVSRRRKKHDARAYAVRLTADGQRHLDSVLPALAAIESDLLKALPVGKRSDLISSLQELATGGASVA